MNNRKINSSNFINETYLDQRCIVNTVLKIVSKRWISEILLLIDNGINRFSELKENLEGISDNVLSQCLSDLVKFGILEKTIFQQVPLKVEYFLSTSGIEVVQHVNSLCDWGKKYLSTNGSSVK